VGRTFNVTRERIRQIETQGLLKLSTLADAAALRDAAA
jgi:RNA polymerase primary sigma factor